MTRPLVSICVPTRNRAGYLRESLASIRAQDYEPLEIVISDNGSDDETQELCLKAAAEDDRIRYVRQPQPLGLYANHNFCIDAARGELLCFFHDDDDRVPELVRTYVDFLTAHPDVGVVSSDWDLIDDDGRWIGAREYRVPAVTPGLQYIERTLRAGRSSVGCPGAMIRRSALGDIRFDEDGAIGFGDFVVWFRIAERHAIGHINRRLWRYRIHRKAFSRRTIESLSHDYESNLRGYLTAHLGRWPDHRAEVARWDALIDRHLFWALLYEVSLTFRAAPADEAPQTIFEFAGYTLADDEVQRALTQARRFATTPARRALAAAVALLVRSGATWPLGFAAAHAGRVRRLVGVR
jgi:glycosyltransferase involved in cell wall biosynthesis